MVELFLDALVQRLIGIEALHEGHYEWRVYSTIEALRFRIVCVGRAEEWYQILTYATIR